MASSVENLVAAAEAEWQHWGKSTWIVVTGARHIGHRDDEAAFAQYVIKHYNSVGGGSPSIADIQNDHYFWSAVGISAIFARAGFKSPDFPFSQSHSTWIRRFVKARKQNLPALYHAYRLNEAQAAPDVGDMVGYTYASVSFDEAQSYFDKTGSYPSHTDIVVAKRSNEIDVIGANVLDSVTRKTLPLTSAGLMKDKTHKWFVVLKRHGF